MNPYVKWPESKGTLPRGKMDGGKSVTMSKNQNVRDPKTVLGGAQVGTKVQAQSEESISMQRKR